MQIKEITSFLDQQIPLQLQESYDNSGFLLGNPEEEFKGALISLDITEEVIQDAVENGFNLVIAHHPIIFKGIKKLTGDTLVERCLMQAIRNNISIYASHTNLDHLSGGVSFALGEKLSLQDMKVLRPLGSLLKKLVSFCPPSHIEKVRQAIFSAGAGHIGNYDSCSYNLDGYGTFRGGEGTNPFVGKPGEVQREEEIRIETVFPAWKSAGVLRALLDAHPYEEVAYDIYPLENKLDSAGPGIIGHYERPVEVMEFLSELKKTLGNPGIRYSPIVNKHVQRIALCGGAGSFLIPDAMRQKADVFITGDLKYHDFFTTEGKIMLLDAGHFETEQFACIVLKEMLSEKFPNFAVQISTVRTNPVNYL